LTLKFCELVAVPSGVVTLTLPVVAPAGTVAEIDEAELTVKMVALVPLNLTAVAPFRFVPVIDTTVPTLPLAGESEEIVGTGGGVVTVKVDELVPVTPAVVTLIVPLVAPVGTVAEIDDAEFTVNVAPVPLNRTEEAPVKPVPKINTLVPAAPLVGENDVTVGAGGGGGGGVPSQPGSWNDPIRVCQLFPVVPLSVVGVAFVYSPTYQNVQPSGSIVIAL